MPRCIKPSARGTPVSRRLLQPYHPTLVHSLILMGRVKLNVVPPPMFAVAQTRPPCDSRMERVIASPKPVP